MLYVKVSGRLGNQMFFYAMMRRVQILNDINEPAVMDFTDVYQRAESAPDEKGFEDSLGIFKVRPYIRVTEKNQLEQYRLPAIKVFENKCLHKLLRWANKVNHREWFCGIQRVFHRVGIYYVDFLVGHVDDTRIKRSRSKNIWIEGRFENPKWFEPIREQLLEEFQPKEPPKIENEELYRIIENTNSICISIRRGDYVTNPDYAKIFNVCDENYFLSAVAEMKKRVNNPVFIIFSDDVQWCKEHIKLEGEQVYYESGNDPLWEKLRLMYSCKHFIISNSTFSWWAQYLSRNENKVVVCPGHWYKDNNTRWPLMEDGFVYLK